MFNKILTRSDIKKSAENEFMELIFEVHKHEHLPFLVNHMEYIDDLNHEFARYFVSKMSDYKYKIYNAEHYNPVQWASESAKELNDAILGLTKSQTKEEALKFIPLIAEVFGFYFAYYASLDHWGVDSIVTVTERLVTVLHTHRIRFKKNYFVDHIKSNWDEKVKYHTDNGQPHIVDQTRNNKVLQDKITTSIRILVE